MAPNTSTGQSQFQPENVREEDTRWEISNADVQTPKESRTLKSQIRSRFLVEAFVVRNFWRLGFGIWDLARSAYLSFPSSS
jgi:hypothetical protein